MIKSTHLEILDLYQLEAGNPIEYIQYALDIERALRGLEKELAACTTPKEISLTAMRVVAEFYQADWCGILDVDLDLGVWTSYWWYSVEFGGMYADDCKELELMDSYERWLQSLRTHEPIVMPDTEEIRESHPLEYAVYQRLNIHATIAVPFWMNFTGFFALKNPKKYKTQTGMMRLMSYAIVTSLNEHHLRKTTKLHAMSPRVASDSDVYICLFGEMKITTSNGVLTESELNSPKICKMLVYLLLSRRKAIAPREIIDAIWPDEDADVQAKNMKSWVYRLQQAFYLISEHRLIESTPSGYRINPKLNIITDITLFDKKWSLAMKSVANEDKADYLQKMADLYEGDLLNSSSSEHWIMATAANYQLRYIGAINELMKVLWEEKNYHQIHSYAEKALQIVKHNADVHYWHIRSMCRQGHIEMARSELKLAQVNLVEEEYETLLNRLSEEANFAAIRP